MPRNPMRARDLSDTALQAERLKLVRTMSERDLSPKEARRWRALNSEGERRWPRVTAADLRLVRRLARALSTALLLAALPARAVCRDQPDGSVLCDRATLEAVRTACVGAERDRDLCRADLAQAQAGEGACRARLAAVEALPAPSDWSWWHVAGAATAGTLLGLVAGLLLAR